MSTECHACATCTYAFIYERFARKEYNFTMERYWLESGPSNKFVLTGFGYNRIRYIGTVLYNYANRAQIETVL